MADADIRRCANRLIDRHGRDAAIFAARHAEELGAAGDIEGKANWKRIMMACLELGRARRDSD